MRYLIKFSYDGSAYSGFQSQRGLETIQEKMEEALTKINNGKKTHLVATGRTDKGVHALAQYGHADIDVNITEKKLKRAMNSNLPNDIHVIETKQVADNFHARYNVKSKTYQYIINTLEYNPIERNYVFQYNYKLNVDKMKEAIKYFLGEHDFRSFATDSKDKENCVREITNVDIKEEKGKIIITFTGNGFLRYQVRNMVGLLIKIGEGKIEPTEVKEIILKKDRTKASKTAPAEGLYLVEVRYKTM
ncbi:MAG: tRNA pseudouridine(38-40) synthase TruA [Bacilli bacterium]|nr:tRNA pseudouridine(38-40) synthase TruA [Bacilli bacterium]